MSAGGNRIVNVFKVLQQRPRIAYLIFGLWAVVICWSVSLSGLSKRQLRVIGQESQGRDAQQILLKVLDEPTNPSGDVLEVPSIYPIPIDPFRERIHMGEEFYTAAYHKNDTSTTIIFNVFRGKPDALRKQLEAALKQKNVVPPDIWVMCFNSPTRNLFEEVVAEMRVKYPVRSSKLVMTVSNFNHKFHGRFLLAYMATTKYVLIVDDDRNLDSTTVYDYIQLMHVQKGVWGNFGHLRASSFEGYKSWPDAGYNLTAVDWVEQDYLCGMWFLEQTWLEYFVKERPPSWATGEDMHLSHVMRKYLNLNSYAGKVALHPPGLPGKDYAATVGSALDLREYIFDHQLGRGNKVANVVQPLNTLVYAESAADIENFIDKLDACSSSDTDNAPWCHAGKVAAVFRGAKNQDVNGLIEAAEKLCNRTSCEYYSAKPNIKHPIHYFNMREGYGQADTGVEIPLQTSASDVIMSLVGILNNVLPSALFLPSFNIAATQDIQHERKNELQIFHNTVLLSVEIHRNSKINPKWSQRQQNQKDSNQTAQAFPLGLKVFVWQRDNESVIVY